MTANELREYFDKTYGLYTWPEKFEVDSETYANVCQEIFNKMGKHIALAYSDGYEITVALGKSCGIKFKDVELILKKN